MDQIDDGGPAFPSNELSQQGDYSVAFHPGMSLRDWFAGQAINGIMQHPVVDDLLRKAIDGRLNRGSMDIPEFTKRLTMVAAFAHSVGEMMVALHYQTMAIDSKCNAASGGAS